MNTKVKKKPRKMKAKKHEAGVFASRVGANYENLIGWSVYCLMPGIGVVYMGLRDTKREADEWLLSLMNTTVLPSLKF
jgi:hypothetical protein